MDPTKWVEWIKLPPKLIFALAATAGLLVFAPARFLNTLGLDVLMASYRGWVGGAFLLFATLLVAHIGAWGYKAVRPWVVQFVLIRRGRRRLRQLDDVEKRLLAKFLNAKSRSIRVDIEDGTVHVLGREMILFQASKIGDFEDGFAFAIQPWAWEHLQKHPELLAPYLTGPRGT